MRRGFKTWAEAKSEELRLALQLPVHGYLPASALARYLGIVVIGPPELPGISAGVVNELLYINPHCWSAATIPIPGGAVVVIHNTCHAPARQESNLMHEISHVICEHRGASIQCSARLPWAFRSYNKDQEDEAKWLGACLQVPRAGLLWAIKCKMADSLIAEHFHASESLVKFRRNTTGVDIQRKRWVRAFAIQ